MPWGIAMVLQVISRLRRCRGGTLESDDPPPLVVPAPPLITIETNAERREMTGQTLSRTLLLP
jgi:hypothetical protein